MVDRTPQQFADGEPDGVTDNTAAIQAAINAWQPGDQVVLSGGTFRTADALLIASAGLVLKGDGVIRAMSGFVGPRMLYVTAEGVVLDTDGLEIDQAGQLAEGVTILASAAPGLTVLNVVSRGAQQAFVRLDGNTTDVLIQACDHLGQGHGIVSFDAAGLARVTLRSSVFAHPGTGIIGDGVRLHCPTHGASEVNVVDCVARGYTGEASGFGNGFAFARVTDSRIVGCTARDCEGDGFRFEQECQRWLCADLRALEIGVPGSLGGNGSGLIAYDCDDIAVVLMMARNCAYHGIALSGEGKAAVLPVQLRLNGLIERCTVDTAGRDGIHMTAQRSFRIDRNWVRDPSLGAATAYAGIHVAQQGGISFENVNGVGTGNLVVLSGATTPLGGIVVRLESINVTIDGVSGSGVLGTAFADGTFWTDATGWLDDAVEDEITDGDLLGEPFSDGTFWSDGTGWLEAA